MTSSQSNNLDFFIKIKDRISGENNILLFNVLDSEHEDLTNSLAISSDLLRDLSLSCINIICAKCLGKFGLKPCPILVELDSQSNVLKVFKPKIELRSTYDH